MSIDFSKVSPPKASEKKLKKLSTKKDVDARSIDKTHQELQKEKEALKQKLKRVEDRAQSVAAVKRATNGSNKVLEESVLDNVTPKTKKIVEDNVIFRPNDGPQTMFLAASEREVFYGGARGGGKSYAMLIDPLRYCHKEKHRALLIRRTMPELRDLIEHSHRLYPKAFPGAKWRQEEKIWRFPSGARIEFGYAETRQDALRYQGQAYTWIGVDELPQYPDAGIWNDLRGSLRSVDPDIPIFMRATGNPGNVGSQWVREMFIDAAPWGTPFTAATPLPDGTTAYITRRFIPARLQDNPYLTQTNDYLIMLASLPETQRKQWLEGDWDVFEDAAFPEFNKNIHVTKAFDIPGSWMKFRSCDWGYSSPACCLWFAVDYDDCLYVYKELYTKGKPADEFARMVLDREQDESVRYGILDSSTWSKRGDVGPSIAETMIKAGCNWRPSDRSPGSRISGKLEVHRRLAHDAMLDGPRIKIFDNCTNLIRTLGRLPLDEHRREDVDTDSEDHAYDALRYGCMSRPITPSHYAQTFVSGRRKRVPADATFGY